MIVHHGHHGHTHGNGPGSTTTAEATKRMLPVSYFSYFLILGAVLFGSAPSA